MSADPEGKITTPGADLDLELTDMAYGGDAVGRGPDGVVFAWGGISGEAVTARIDRVKRDLAWATVTAIHQPSPLRVAPPCPYFGPCGGCQWQQVDYPGQLSFKTHILREQLRRGGGMSDDALDGVLHPAAGMDDPWAYRNVAHFQVDPVTRRLGYFRRTSHDVVAVDTCPISDPGINAVLPGLQELFTTHAQAPGDLPPNLGAPELERVRRGELPVSVRERRVSGMPVWQVTVRTGAPPADAPDDAPWAGRQLVIILHTYTGEAPARRGRGRGTTDESPRAAVYLGRKAVRKWVADLTGQVSVVELRQDGSLDLVAETPAAGAATAEEIADLGVAGLVSGSRRAAAEAPADAPESPPGVVRQQLGGQTFHLAPQAFFQINNAQAETILRLIRAALPANVPVLVDAYSGAGAFALALLHAGAVGRVVAIESDWAAVESARWTAALLRLAPGRFQIEQGRVEALLPALDVAPDALLLDPPRAGCAPAVLQHLLAHPVPRVVYVSCDPSTLARDLRILAAGYTLDRAQPVDMFPQTYHIETVAVLTARPAAPKSP